MPTYSYACHNCGHKLDVIQRMSDPLLVKCPECGQLTLDKQLTAPASIKCGNDHAPRRNG